MAEQGQALSLTNEYGRYRIAPIQLNVSEQQPHSETVRPAPFVVYGVMRCYAVPAYFQGKLFLNMKTVSARWQT